jgi:hypothetical protein
VAGGGLWLELGLALLAKQRWPPRLGADGGKPRRMLPVLSLKLSTQGVALLLGFSQRHASSVLRDHGAGKPGLPTGRCKLGNLRPLPYQERSRACDLPRLMPELSSRSVGVHHRPLAVATIVTQLVTQHRGLSITSRAVTFRAVA